MTGSTPATAEDNKKKKLTGPEIAGIVVAAIVVIGGLVVAFMMHKHGQLKAGDAKAVTGASKGPAPTLN